MKQIIFLTLLVFSFSIHSYAQDSCATAVPVSAGIHYTVPVIDGTDPPFWACAPNTSVGQHAEWYQYTVTDDTSVTVTTDLPQNTGGDTRFNVYTGVCGSFSLVCVIGDDDGGSGLLSTATFQGQQGVTYYIAFDDFWSSDGFDFEIILSAPLASAVDFTATQLDCNTCGYCVVDMDGDFLDDVVGISTDSVNMHFQQPGGGFVHRVVHTTSADHPASWSMCAGDLDNNGFTDLVYAGGGGATIMMADSAGHAFTEISPQQYIFPQRSNTVDINNDGWLDVFVCHDVDSNVYFMNDTNSGFITHVGGLGNNPSGGNYGSLWTDIDGDGDIDMHISKCGAANINELHLNDGTGNYSEVAISYNLADPTQTWSSAIGDFDHDGDMDIIIGASSGTHKVMRNDGNTFTDVTSGSGFDLFTGNSIEWVTQDFDNDGNLDVMGAGAFMMGNGDLTFVQSPTLINNGAIGDMNSDGFLDILNGSTMYMNDGNANNWIRIHTVGTVSNIDGIGARVEIYSPSGTQVREIRSGEGFRYMSSLVAHFGLGIETQVDSVTVFWPSGVINTIVSPNINENLVIIEEVEEPVISSVGSFNESSDWSLFPSPADDLISISGPAFDGETTYKVFDLSGGLIMAGTLSSNHINISELKDGIYVVHLMVEESSIFQGQFVKVE